MSGGDDQIRRGNGRGPHELRGRARDEHGEEYHDGAAFQADWRGFGDDECDAQGPDLRVPRNRDGCHEHWNSLSS